MCGYYVLSDARSLYETVLSSFVKTKEILFTVALHARLLISNIKIKVLSGYTNEYLSVHKPVALYLMLLLILKKLKIKKKKDAKDKITVLFIRLRCYQ